MSNSTFNISPNPVILNFFLLSKTLFQLTRSSPWRLWWGTATTQGSRTSPTSTSRSTSRTPTSPWTTTLMERLENSLHPDGPMLFILLFCRAQRRTITCGLVNFERSMSLHAYSIHSYCSLLFNIQTANYWFLKFGIQWFLDMSFIKCLFLQVQIPNVWGHIQFHATGAGQVIWTRIIISRIREKTFHINWSWLHSVCYREREMEEDLI